MKVEMYIINTDKTWSTEWVNIPDDTAEENIKDVAETMMLEMLNKENIDVDGVAVRYYEK